MTNRINKTAFHITRLSAAEAEVVITATVEYRSQTTNLRGKLVGPRCPGASTIEVAYPLRAMLAATTKQSTELLLCAVIPEPNLWTDTMPFSYEATVELWQDGVSCDRVKVWIGLKFGDESAKVP